MAHGNDCPVVACPGDATMCKSTKACGMNKDMHVYACV
jgi:hypothetical protein